MTPNTRSLEDERAKLVMIQPEPFNAEAPPEALHGDITPTELHYVRSNFALPLHDGTLEVGGAVDRSLSLTVADLRAMKAVTHAVTFECAGNGRLGQAPMPVGEPWGFYAVSTAEWKGALLHEVLEQAAPHADGVDVRFEGADHGPYYQYEDITYVRSLDLAHAADPGSDILIAYEMNGATASGARPGPAAERSLASRSASGAKESGSQRRYRPRADRTSGRTGCSTGGSTSPAGTRSERAPPTARATQPDSPPWNRLGYGNNAVEILYVDVR